MATTDTRTARPQTPAAAKSANVLPLSGAALAAALGVEETVANRLLPVAEALVEDYAPQAPAALRREAVIRVSGWLAEQPMAARRSGTIGDVTRQYAPSMTGAMLYSGAKSLLYPFRVKTAGVAR